MQNCALSRINCVYASRALILVCLQSCALLCALSLDTLSLTVRLSGSRACSARSAAAAVAVATASFVPLCVLGSCSLSSLLVALEAGRRDFCAALALGFCFCICSSFPNICYCFVFVIREKVWQEMHKFRAPLFPV